jgi:hypothetical protein
VIHIINIKNLKSVIINWIINILAGERKKKIKEDDIQRLIAEIYKCEN